MSQSHSLASLLGWCLGFALGRPFELVPVSGDQSFRPVKTVKTSEFVFVGEIRKCKAKAKPASWLNKTFGYRTC